RVASSNFGIRTYGVHISGFTRSATGELRMWAGRRSLSKPTWTGHLDQIAAGGIGDGVGAWECMVKECGEEAGIPPELARHGRFVGTIRFFARTEMGLQPETQLVFDLEPPSDFVPVPTDGEVESFLHLTLDETAERLRLGRFKPNCAACVVDFLLLPLHVIDLIVNHVADSSRLAFDGVLPNSHEYRVLLKPLLQVCHNLRAAAAAYLCFCHSSEINLSSLSVDSLGEHYLKVPQTHVAYRRRNYLGYSTHRMAKNVTHISYDAPQVEASIDALVRRIKLMVPIMAIEYGVQPVLRSEPCVLDQFSNDLATRLYQLASRVNHDHIFERMDHVELQVDLMRNLTHVSYQTGPSMGNSCQYIQLARNSAATPQSLALGCEPDIYIPGIVIDADGNHVSYSRLRKLDIHKMHDSSGLE
ncbi:hypothetical protein IW152_004414, partial [Coemansia sp. BCRC 34962]